MPSENSVMANFGEFPFRDCPKRVGGACGVTLRSTSTVLFDPFWPPCASQIHAHSVALTPFRTVSEGEFSEVHLKGCAKSDELVILRPSSAALSSRLMTSMTRLSSTAGFPAAAATPRSEGLGGGTRISRG